LDDHPSSCNNRVFNTFFSKHVDGTCGNSAIQSIDLVQTRLNDEPQNIGHHNAHSLGDTGRTEREFPMRKWQISTDSCVSIDIDRASQQA
jgi:hypothetical protein